MIYIQSQQCVGCGTCVDTCPEGAIQLVNGVAAINQDKCQQCEVCLTVCPNNAIVAILDLEPVSDAPGFVPVPSRPAAVQHSSPASSIMPLIGTALAFVSREILPRVAVSLLEMWDNRTRTRQPTALSSAAPSAASNSRATPVTVIGNRGRKNRQRRRGRW